MGKKLALGAAAALLLVAIAVVAMIGPRNVVGMLRYDIRRDGALRVGDRAPDVALVALDGAPVRLAPRFGARPAVVIFGSFT